MIAFLETTKFCDLKWIEKSLKKNLVLLAQLSFR